MSRRSFPGRAGILFLPATAILALGCGDVAAPSPDPDGRGGNAPAFSIQDGAHNQGNSHFYFLPPMVDRPAFGGAFDASQQPHVLICTLTPTAACNDVVASFTMTGGTGGESIRVTPQDELYVVNWHTDRCARQSDGGDEPCTLTPGQLYRLSVLVGNARLGHADIKALSSPGEVRNITDGETVPLVNGRTLPVKFRIETGAVIALPVGESATVPVEGGVVSTADGAAALYVPAGAVSQPVSIAIQLPTGVPPGSDPTFPVVELSPDRQQFAKPVTLALTFDPAALAEGIAPDMLEMVTWNGQGWETVANSRFNEIASAVEAPLEHFSTYTVRIAPTALVGPAAVTLQQGATTTLDAYVLRAESRPGRTYCFSRPVASRDFSWQCRTTSGTFAYPVAYAQLYWSSAAPSIASFASRTSVTDAVGRAISPPLTGDVPGSTSVRAAARLEPTGFFVSNPIAVDVTARPQASGQVVFARDFGGQDFDIFAVNADGSNVRRLTSDLNRDDEPHVSPDGTRIAFVSTRAGSFDIWTMQIDGSNQQNITPIGHFDAEPAWSPDGSRIAYNSCRGDGCDIYTMRPDGSDERRVTATNNQTGQPDWAPDGQRLAFISEVTGNQEVYTAGLDGSEMVQVTSNPSDDINPSWSPDGSRIAFSRGGHIFSIRPDGTEERQLTSTGADNNRPDWSADGVRIIFRGLRNSRSMLLSINADGTDLQEITTPPAPGDHHPSWVFAPPAVPQLRGLIAFTSDQGGPTGLFSALNIWTMAPDGSNPLQVNADPEADDEPDLSPDRTRIAFTGLRSGSYDLWIMGIDGSNAINILPGSNFDAEPDWSPDGARLAFNSCRDGCDLYTIAPNGSGEQRVTTTRSSTGQPEWDPTGQRIAFTSAMSGGFDLYTVRPDGSDIRRLTTSSGDDFHPAWSPDRSRIAFSRDRNIYVMNSDGSYEVQLTQDGASNDRPAWSPDGNWIVYRSSRDGLPKVYRMRADGSEQVRLSSQAAGNAHPSWR